MTYTSPKYPNNSDQSSNSLQFQHKSETVINTKEKKMKISNGNKKKHHEKNWKKGTNNEYPDKN